jgi:hypothetical protein
VGREFGGGFFSWVLVVVVIFFGFFAVFVWEREL